MKNCKFCGEEIEDSVNICIYCGEKNDSLEPKNIENESTNQSVNGDESVNSNDNRPSFFYYYFYDVFIENFANFKGVTPLKQFCFASFIYFMILAVIIMLLIITSAINETLVTITLIICSWGFLTLSIPWVALQIRRLRDTAYSPWFIFLQFVTPIGFIAYIILLLQEGRVKSKKIKLIALDYSIFMLVFVLLGFSIIMGDKIFEEEEIKENQVEYIDTSFSDLSYNERISLFEESLEDDEKIISIYPDEFRHSIFYSKLKYPLEEKFRNYSIKQFDIETGEDFNLLFDEIGFINTDEDAQISSIYDYAINGDDIILIGDNGWNVAGAGYYLFVLNTITNKFRLIDFGRNVEFVNNKRRVKVSKVKDYIEGECAADSYFTYDDVFYILKDL